MENAWRPREKNEKKEKRKHKGAKRKDGVKRVWLRESRSFRSQAASSLYIQPEQLESRHHGRERKRERKLHSLIIQITS